MSLQEGLDTLLVVSLVAALAPLAAGLLHRLRVPQVVLLILGGILVGPDVLGWGDPDSIELISNVGLGFLFLLAGYELELELFRRRPGRLAISAWLVTVAVALAVTGVLAAIGFVEAFVPIAIGLTTTALGTLLPILRDNDMLGGRFGSYILAAGAVGEFLPIVAITIFLGASGSFVGLLSLLAMGALAGLFTIAAPAGAPPAARQDPGRGRARDVPDDAAVDGVPALRPAGRGRGLRAGRRARRVPGRRRAPQVGAAGRARPRGRSWTPSATASSSRCSSSARA